MREIKFRAWDSNAKRFILKPRWQACYNSAGCELQQYIGLKDNAGVEVYEGDIINFWGGKGVVVYSNSAFVISVTPDMDAIASDEFDFYKGMEVEVTGNIHEGSRD